MQKMLSLITCVSALTLFTAAGAYAGQRDDRRGSIPSDIDVDVPSDAVLFLVGHGFGTQNYVCLPSGTGFAFSLFTPQATLFNDGSQQLITHFFSPNPEEKGTIRATWEHSRDSSMVWAAAVKQVIVREDSIPWLRLDVKGTAAGPTGGRTLTQTKFIQRINTLGGVAPATGCSSAADVGHKEFVPYFADYLFYKVPAEKQ